MGNDNSIVVPIDKVKTWDKNDDLRIVKREDFQICNPAKNNLSLFLKEWAKGRTESWA